MAETSPVGIDAEKVTAWLAAAIGLLPPLELQRIGHGQSNLTYLVEDRGGTRVVLRRPPLGELARGAHDMGREHRILTGLAFQAVPTPRPLAMTSDPSVTGAPVYVMEHVEGIVLHTDESAQALPPQARARAADATVSALAALHDVDVDAAGLGELARRDGYAERQLRGWSRQWEATRTRELPTIEQTAQKLAAAVPPQREVALVHGDYNLANLIVAPDGDVRAILDWELATLGDPVADIGTLLCYWPESGDERLLERDPVTLLPGFPGRTHLVEHYAQAATDRDLSGLPFWRALATWKLAIILEGVTRRRMANPANSRTSPEQLRRATDQLADSAAELAGSLRRPGASPGSRRPRERR
jgi:aminoglycoside phosphotransferase (APT) family kinase protein